MKRLSILLALGALTIPRVALAQSDFSRPAYNRIQQGNTNLPQRRTVSFSGSSVNCTDDAGNQRTTCAISGGTVTSITIGAGLSSTQSPLITTGTLSVTEPLPTHSAAGKLPYDTGGGYGLTTAGTSHQLLHGAAGAPTWSPVDLTADIIGTLPVANGGTNSSTALSNGYAMVSSGGKIVEAKSANATGSTTLVNSPPLAFQGSAWDGAAAQPSTWSIYATPFAPNLSGVNFDWNGTNYLNVVAIAGEVALGSGLGQTVNLAGYPNDGVLAIEFDARATYTAGQVIYQFDDGGTPILQIADNGSNKALLLGLAPPPGIQTLGTSGAVTWNPSTGLVNGGNSTTARLTITGNVTSLTMSAPTAEGQLATLVYTGDGSHSWPATVSGALLVGGAFAAPTASQTNVVTFVGSLTIGGGKWIQNAPTAVNVQ